MTAIRFGERSTPPTGYVPFGVPSEVRVAARRPWLRGPG